MLWTIPGCRPSIDRTPTQGIGVQSHRMGQSACCCCYFGCMSYTRAAVVATAFGCVPIQAVVVVADTDSSEAAAAEEPPHTQTKNAAGMTVNCIAGETAWSPDAAAGSSAVS